MFSVAGEILCISPYVGVVFIKKDPAIGFYAKQKIKLVQIIAGNVIQVCFTVEELVDGKVQVVVVDLSIGAREPRFNGSIARHLEKSVKIIDEELATPACDAQIAEFLSSGVKSE